MIDEKRLAQVLREEAGVIMAAVGPGRGSRAPQPPSLSAGDVRTEALRVMAAGWMQLAGTLDPE